ncbi:hypothetical protein M0811_13003 [Anaeramoeba ignava]|uniref:Uncharacterized protein n=1 Tax=Anaeramoeba ignava TaxID=1746090 RepID=A0A9Q0R5J7_ANAIG|nr:hypothetical protein M0811_13003 [Anaeramoeba ignava]
METKDITLIYVSKNDPSILVLKIRNKTYKPKTSFQGIHFFTFQSGHSFSYSINNSQTIEVRESQKQIFFRFDCEKPDTYLIRDAQFISRFLFLLSSHFHESIFAGLLTQSTKKIFIESNKIIYFAHKHSKNKTAYEKIYPLLKKIRKIPNTQLTTESMKIRFLPLFDTFSPDFTDKKSDYHFELPEQINQDDLEICLNSFLETRKDVPQTVIDFLFDFNTDSKKKNWNNFVNSPFFKISKFQLFGMESFQELFGKIVFPTLKNWFEFWIEFPFKNQNQNQISQIAIQNLEYQPSYNEKNSTKKLNNLLQIFNSQAYQKYGNQKKKKKKKKNQKQNEKKKKKQKAKAKAKAKAKS